MSQCDKNYRSLDLKELADHWCSLVAEFVRRGEGFPPGDRHSAVSSIEPSEADKRCEAAGGPGWTERVQLWWRDNGPAHWEPLELHKRFGATAKMLVALELELRAARSATRQSTMICPKCGTDRLKAACPTSQFNCPMVGDTRGPL